MMPPIDAIILLINDARQDVSVQICALVFAIGRGGYSLLRLFTGLLVAALNDSKLTVSQAIRMLPAPAKTKTSKLMVVL